MRLALEECNAGLTRGGAVPARGFAALGRLGPAEGGRKTETNEAGRATVRERRSPLLTRWLGGGSKRDWGARSDPMRGRRHALKEEIGYWKGWTLAPARHPRSDNASAAGR